MNNPNTTFGQFLCLFQLIKSRDMHLESYGTKIEPIVCKFCLCLGRNRETNKQDSCSLPVYYLSEVFKAHLVPFWS